MGIRVSRHTESKKLCMMTLLVASPLAKAITFSQGHYQVALSWKEFHDTLPDNYLVSLKRLHGLLHTLRQEPAILEQYERTIKEQIEKDVSEPTSSIVHYLPHHAVVRTDKATTRLRVVYDASARSSGPSVIDCLHKGPKFIS